MFERVKRRVNSSFNMFERVKWRNLKRQETNVKASFSQMCRLEMFVRVNIAHLDLQYSDRTANPSVLFQRKLVLPRC